MSLTPPYPSCILTLDLLLFLAILEKTYEMRLLIASAWLFLSVFVLTEAQRILRVSVCAETDSSISPASGPSQTPIISGRSIAQGGS